MKSHTMFFKRTVWFLFFKLLLFQYFTPQCSARFVSNNDSSFISSVNYTDNNNKLYNITPIDISNDMNQEILIDEDVKKPQEIRGLYSMHHILSDDYEVTIPVRVTADGSFISNSLSVPHEVSPSGKHTRKRRSLAPGDSIDDEDLNELVHFNITVGGTPLRLNLRPEVGFISPLLVVEKRRHDIHTRTKTFEGDNNNCHYRGQVHGQPDSHVALSACNGLAGLLRTEQGEYWMEPGVHLNGNIDEAEHPHIIFKRSALRQQPHDRPRKFKKNKKKMGKKKANLRKKRRRRQKNCATKQPPRNDLWKDNMTWEQEPKNSRLQGNRLINNLKNSGQRRLPRSVSKPRHVEVLLVADSSMTDFHQEGNVETYLLTIMNMVSSLYLDPTIGNFINIIVVKIILLEDDVNAQGLNITTNADTTLSNFCRWQRELNPIDDNHPNHHDVAILITRKDICARQNVPCSTLGVAHVAGMCLPDRSCSVNEDNGITLAHTITHELGHNFGMYHDTEKIGCHRRVGSTLHVMTPIFEADTVEVAWSRCSRRDLTNFLDSGMGECLADQPAHVDYAYPELPAGALYDAGRQCRLQFGSGVDEVCTELAEICQRLWCVVNGTCTTMLRPAAPGTECGENMWCQNHTCVPRTSPPPPVHGGWGDWGPWSACSRSCGAGVSVTKRHCDNPRPNHGGNFCTGERTRYQVCNTQPCPTGEPSFRQMQCSKYDNTTYEGKFRKWQPYFDQDEPCELYCSTADETVIVPFGEYALDGTPCKMGTRDMCISGICRKVGCDWIVDSDAVEDNCGVCNGNGTDCQQVQGIYDMGTAKESGYSEVAIIPAGSKNIKIEEVSNSKNYIGIGSTRTRKFYLNGRRKVKLAGEYLVAGAPALYERDRDWEKVKIPGPINEDILIYQMIYRGGHRNPGVHYQYTVDKKKDGNGAEMAKYYWSLGEWTPCTKTCGGGLTRRPVLCMDSTAGIVDQELCISNTEMDKPSEMMKVCNNKPCSTYWWVGAWSACPPCIKQNQTHPLRNRKVWCRNRQDNRILPDSECDPTNKPILYINCAGLSKCHHRY